MKIGIAVFTYNRSNHLQLVLNGLKKNEGIDKLYIFQDGLKNNEHRKEWNEVRKVIDNITWCEKICFFSEYNKGLARSIVEGINFVLEENDAIIVLEDDCVPAVNFISFMKQCFEKYQNDKRVYTVSGYSWPIEQEQTQYDVYGCGRISSWGWGTWKDRWEKYRIDNNILKRLKKEEIASRNLSIWGSDLEKMLLDCIAYKNDSWAVYWALNVIENEGICINPYRSLIQNIGNDGSGVNCGLTNIYEVALSDEEKDRFELPDKIEILEKTKSAFAKLYGSYTASNEGKQKEKILIYGLGNFYLENERMINDRYSVEAFIDIGKKGWFAGKKIIQLSEIKNYDYNKIIIMIQNIQECINVGKKLIDFNINYKKIVYGHSFYGYYSKMINKMDILSDGKVLLNIEGISVKVQSEDEFNNVFEVLKMKIYDYFINNNKRDIVIDVGMNIGDAVLYFLNNHKVEKVYGYEPFKKTYLIAEDNLKIHLNENNRIEIFQFGISNENKKCFINYNRDMTCGQSTIESVRERTYAVYQTLRLVHDEKEEKEQIEVKAASEVFLPIFNKHLHNNIILKMDCEGEEYGIIEELSNKKLLSRFTFIMLEWHYKGKDRIIQLLKEAEFSYWCNDKTNNMGLIYALNKKI